MRSGPVTRAQARVVQAANPAPHSQPLPDRATFTPAALSPSKTMKRNHDATAKERDGANDIAAVAVLISGRTVCRDAASNSENGRFSEFKNSLARRNRRLLLQMCNLNTCIMKALEQDDVSFERYGTLLRALRSPLDFDKIDALAGDLSEMPQVQLLIRCHCETLKRLNQKYLGFLVRYRPQTRQQQQQSRSRTALFHASSHRTAVASSGSGSGAGAGAAVSSPARRRAPKRGRSRVDVTGMTTDNAQSTLASTTKKPRKQPTRFSPRLAAKRAQVADSKPSLKRQPSIYAPRDFGR